jgi:RNA polymerase sigma-70 factor (ECF subfamily)
MPYLWRLPDAELNVLIHAVAGGCRVSFTTLYQVSSGPLFGTVLRVNGDRGEAEDVLQEVYVRVWRDSGQFSPERGRPVDWLTGMARHAAIDSLRRRHVRRRVDPPGGLDFEAWCATCPSGAPGPLEAAIERERGSAIHHHLKALPCLQRECVALAFYAGLSHAEVAQHMRQPLGTVKSWIRRSLANLGRALRADETWAQAGGTRRP